MNEEKPLWLLNELSQILTWFEEMLILAAGPLITFGLVVAMVDLVTGGTLFIQAAWLDYAYGIAQAVGIEGQLLGFAYRAHKAFHNERVVAGMGFSILTIALSIVTMLGAWVFIYQQTFHVPTITALAFIGITPQVWTFGRAGIQTILAVLSGILRYVAPVSIKELQARTDRQKEFIQQQSTLREAKRNARIGAIRGWVQGLQEVQKSDTSPIVPSPDEQYMLPSRTNPDAHVVDVDHLLRDLMPQEE